MNAEKEWIYFDDDDEGNTDYIKGMVPYGTNPDKDFNIKLFFCYYTKLQQKNLPENDVKLLAVQNTKGRKKGNKMIIAGSLIAVGGIVISGAVASIVMKGKFIRSLFSKQ